MRPRKIESEKINRGRIISNQKKNTTTTTTDNQKKNTATTTTDNQRGTAKNKNIPTEDTINATAPAIPILVTSTKI